MEFRHPDAAPEWIENADGTINETAIKEYWEEELAGFIDWAELKKTVLDPIAANPFFLDKTDKYDENSVMNWPFFKWINLRQKPIQFDSDFKTELSADDKEFVESIYGKSFYPMPLTDLVLPLVEFDYTGTTTRFYVTTSKRLVVLWDEKSCTYVDVPTGSTNPVTATVEHTYTDSIKRRIVIGEMLEYGQSKPTTSEALVGFDLFAAGVGDYDIKDYNSALSNITFRGSSSMESEHPKFDFSGRKKLKEVYLSETLESTVTVRNCENLEIFATSLSIWKPLWVKPTTIPGLNTGNTDGFVSSGGSAVINVWPYVATYDLSLTSLDIELCPKLKQISLENAQLSSLVLSGHPDLEYVYLSSSPYYIVGGGSPAGSYLVNALKGLPDRTGKSRGQVILRSIKLKNVPVGYDTPQQRFEYCSVPISSAALNTINTLAEERNWMIKWPSGYSLK